MIHIKKYLLLFLILAAKSAAFCQMSFSEQNVSYMYAISGELMVEHLTSFEGENFELDLLISLNRPINVSFDSIYDIGIVLKKDYKSEEELGSLPVSALKLLKASDSKKFHFHLSGINTQDARLLELSVTNKITGEEYAFDISLDPDAEYGNAGLIKYETRDSLPLMSNFVNSGNSFQIKDKAEDTAKLWVYHYKSDFDIAVPPMIIDYKSTSKSLSVNELSEIKSDSLIAFAEEGLYFIQKDTSSLEGIGFRVAERPFPKLGAYEALIQPLRYISTKEEYDKFATTNNLERAFQKFWIEKADSEEAAKKSIGNFYRSVAEANFFFTGYKEGWKTDMGMIYIIYGPPNKVYRHEEYEEWVYQQSINLPALRFTFVKIKNVFSSNHYTLVRDKKFDKHWFRAVELWRTGKK